MANILLVEDDEILAEVLAEALEAAGHMVTSVGVAAEALIAIQTGAPDLVVADYELPDVTGLQIVREMRAHPHFNRTPVVMMTAKKSNLLCARAVSEGASAYLPKPVWPNELVSRVEGLLRTQGFARSARRGESIL